MSSVNYKELLKEAKKLEGTKSIKKTINNKSNVYGYQINLFNLDKGNVWVSGWSNRCRDGSLIFNGDYDKMRQKWVEEDIINLQTEGIQVPGTSKPIYLETTALFQSSKNSFHAVCLSKYTAMEFIQLLRRSNVDEAYKSIPRWKTERSWINRAFSKGSKNAPKFVKLLRVNGQRKQSNGHYELLKLLYPKLPIKLKRPDAYNKEDVQLIRYKSSEEKRL